MHSYHQDRWIASRPEEPADRAVRAVRPQDARTQDARTQDARTQDARTQDARTQDVRLHDVRLHDVRPVPSPRDLALRAGDADRDATAAVLGQALAFGYLTDEEFGSRIERAMTARTHGDLRDVVADLPADRLAGNRLAAVPASVPGGPVQDGRGRRARRGVRAHLASWATVSVICLAVWAVTAVLFGATYFWPIWPILGMGVGVLSHAVPVNARLAAARPGCGRGLPPSLR